MSKRAIPALITTTLLAACTPAASPDAEFDLEEGFEPRAEPIQDIEGALGLMRADTSKAFDAEMGSLEPKEQAHQTNAMAWAGEHPRELRVLFGRRATPTHVSGRYLAFDASPKLEPQPSPERAKDLFEDGGFGRGLLGLEPVDDVQLVGQFDREDGSFRFDFERTWQGYAVEDGGIFVVLDAKGRLTQVDAGEAVHIDPQNTLAIDHETAIEHAIADLESRKDPLWDKADIHPARVEKRIANVSPYVGVDEDRFVWRVELTNLVGAGYRVVTIDGETKQTLASLEQTRYMLDPRDAIERYNGVIGGPVERAPVSPFDWSGDLWDSAHDPCADTSDPVAGSDPLERDRDEAKAALCEATRLVESGSTHGFREWFDPEENGLKVALGLTPLLSVGMNDTQRIFFAAGVGRAEVIGHELFHTALGRSPLTRITSGRAAERGAIEEHMSDAFGILLERRFHHRSHFGVVEEDACLLNDDADSRATHASQDLDPSRTDLAYRPCADLGAAGPWRSTCAPTQDNAGWCEGAARYQDLGYNGYDTYGATSGTNNHIASHTNLGIGNRVFMAMLGAPQAGFNGSRFIAQSDPAMLEMLLLATTRLVGNVDWSVWGRAWLDAARVVDGTATVGPAERHLVAQLERAGVWSPVSAVQAATGAASPSLINPPQGLGTAAASTVIRRSGDEALERTYVFYRPHVFSDEVAYAWRDDPRGGSVSVPTGDWTGPCTLPGVSTRNDVAAVGREDGGLFVAWNDSATEAGVGDLRLLSLLPGGEADEGSCETTAWVEVMPAQTRSMQGSPSVANWTATSDRTICEILEADFPGLELPFRTIGAMGLNIGDCVDIGERLPPYFPSPLPDWIGPWLLELITPPLEATPSLGIPAPFDPLNPALRPGSIERHYPLASLLTKSEDTKAQLSQVKVLGPRFAAAFEEGGLPDAHRAELITRWSIDDQQGDPKSGLPLGEIETVEWRFVDERLVVAFRDASGAVRVAPFTDPRPTSDIPLLESEPVADPALATASRRARDPDTGLGFELGHLYVVYGVTKDDGEGPVPNRLVERHATFLDDPSDPDAFAESIFSDPARLDTISDVRGTRRHVNYANLRTRRKPTVVGGLGQLHVFVVGPQAPSHAPSDGDVPEVGTAPGSERIRHAQLGVLPDGSLTWDSERPTQLEQTNNLSGSPGSEAGSAVVTHQRQKLRFFFSDGRQLQSRSRY